MRSKSWQHRIRLYERDASDAALHARLEALGASNELNEWMRDALMKKFMSEVVPVIASGTNLAQSLMEPQPASKALVPAPEDKVVLGKPTLPSSFGSRQKTNVFARTGAPVPAVVGRKSDPTLSAFYAPRKDND